MPGTSASHAIFFIASLIVATAVAGVFMGTSMRFSNDLKTKSNAYEYQMNTEVTIINDPSAMPYDSTNQTLVLYVKNIGTTSLYECATRVLIDGNYSMSNNLTFKLLDGATAWGNEVTLQITVGNCTLISGDHKAKVIVEHGRSTTLAFKI
jgi:flagellar protein FlaG